MILIHSSEGEILDVVLDVNYKFYRNYHNIEVFEFSIEEIPENLDLMERISSFEAISNNKFVIKNGKLMERV